MEFENVDDELKRLRIELLGFSPEGESLEERLFKSSKIAKSSLCNAILALESVRMELEDQIRRSKQIAIQAHEMANSSLSKNEVDKIFQHIASKNIHIELVKILSNQLPVIDRELEGLKQQLRDV